MDLLEDVDVGMYVGREAVRQGEEDSRREMGIKIYHHKVEIMIHLREIFDIINGIGGDAESLGT